MPGFEIFGEEERKEVQDVLETGVLFRYGFDGARKGHWKAASFEKEFCRRIQVGYAHLCSSGTAALSIALAACGVGAGDEVVIPPFTFVATVEAVLLAGAVPVFAEIDESLCLDPASVKALLTDRTKAVIPVHMCGAMAQIDEIKALCEAENLILIEDSCQSVGGSFQGKYLGTFGHMGCFSFDPVKTLTCGEGGAVVTNDRELYRKADAYADHGHDHMGNDRGLEQHDIFGCNYRISELNAAVGLAQLRKLDRILEIQRKHKSKIKSALADCPDLHFRNLPDASGDTGTFLSFFLPDEDAARYAAAELTKAGVDGCFYWFDNNWHYIRQWMHLKNMSTAARLPLHLMDSCPDYSKVELPQSDKVMGRTISMLIRLSWTEAGIDKRIEKMMKILKG
ncbi:MAG: DegT/DnrJ/EryC1/StrS family aminotransferase [Desulfococcaceae bacterium]|jgi:8-amino-3,8-dideoxy-alpha-D-manno-octulosonate transaminase|nr:DegT/DnrJ/EryC1/StrS family aminotransferase [Desulfococcaceae bacterium]